MTVIKEMVEYVTKALVDDPDAVHVSETVGAGTLLVDLHVAPGDIGRVIGRKGRHINAMRTLTRVLGAKNGTRAVKMRQRLEQEMQTVRNELERLDERLQAKGEYGHGKGDPLVVGWEFNLARRQQVEQDIELIEAALKRVDEGTHGICAVCSHAIDPERLEALPYSTLCVACARNG